MLSTAAAPVIETTLPLIDARIGAITRKFYQRMFTAHPELLDGMFSRANQRDGRQQQALAGAISAFAAHLLEHPDALPEAVLSRIAHKHVSLGVTEEQYRIVHRHLFDAIADELGNTLTAEIAAAWDEVYWLMAHALIALEGRLRDGRPGGNGAWSHWRVAERWAASDTATTFVLEPREEADSLPGKPGQYISVRIPVADGLLQARQYSLSADANATGRRVITIRKHDDGEVSPRLHEEYLPGSVVELSDPCGDTVLVDGEEALVLISAGIGCTPHASILRHLAEQGSTREVIVLHADRSLSQWTLRQQMTRDALTLGSRPILWLREPSDGSETGPLTLTPSLLPEGATLHLCGPMPFMRSIRSQAINLGVHPTNIRYEVFGPDLWLASQGT